MTPSQNQLTQLLIEWREVDETARDELMPLVYNELRRMAQRLFVDADKKTIAPRFTYRSRV